jgi:hypothetical protein
MEIKKKGRLKVTFENDEHTPVMVQDEKRNLFCNYFTIVDTGEFEDNDQSFPINKKEMEWLDSLLETAEKWHQEVRKDKEI